jgi:hypothetical protein
MRRCCARGRCARVAQMSDLIDNIDTAINSMQIEDTQIEDDEPNIFGWKKSYGKVSRVAFAAAQDAENQGAEDASKDMLDNQDTEDQDAEKDAEDQVAEKDAEDDQDDQDAEDDEDEDMVEDMMYALVPYNNACVLTEGLLAQPPQPRTKEEHMALHSDVVGKTGSMLTC